MPSLEPAAIIAQAIGHRKLRNQALQAAKNPVARFEARDGVDEERRRVRDAMRKHRAAKRSQQKSNSAKAKARAKAKVTAKAKAKATAKAKAKAKALERTPGQTGSSAAKPTSRHIPCNCCGRRKENCNCFTTGRGLEIARSLKRKKLEPIPERVRKSRIQTWHDTGDMPAYMRQIGWNASMRYSWLVPAAFMWRHFSNEEFWNALQKVDAVKTNQLPNFSMIEKVMRAFEGEGVSYHGGLFYSGAALTEYRFGSAAMPARWQKCRADQDFTAKEIMSLKVMWHVAGNFKKSYDSLQKQPSRQCWKACTKEFVEALQQHTKGCFGDYSLKIALDGILLSQPRLETVVSWWPMLCSAYKKQLPELYSQCSSTSQDDLFLAGCHFHQCLKASCPKFLLRDSLAQTCWIKRNVT